MSEVTEQSQQFEMGPEGNSQVVAGQANLPQAQVSQFFPFGFGFGSPFFGAPFFGGPFFGGPFFGGPFGGPFFGGPFFPFRRRFFW